MKIIKTVLFKTLLFYVLVILFFSGITGFFITPTSSKSDKFTVVIDAGHGGIDGGATGVLTGVRESDVNLLIANNLQKLFLDKGFVVIMTRTEDVGLYGTTEPGFKKRDLTKRVEIINGSNADVAISIHLNVYSSSSRRGAQTFFSNDNVESENLAKQIQSRINGMSMMPRLSDALKGDYYLLNESKIPTAIVECGFLSNKDDEKLLLSEEYRNQISNAIFGGCLAYLAS